MKISITRSFSRTKQVAAFEPNNAFCSASIETDITEPTTQDEEILFKKACAMYSAGLDEIVRSEVEKTIDAELARRKSPPPIQDPAKVEETDPNAEQPDKIIDEEAVKKTGGYHAI